MSGTKYLFIISYILCIISNATAESLRKNILWVLNSFDRKYIRKAEGVAHTFNLLFL
jgi:hypothetical protein